MSRESVIVDTNVAIAANGDADHVDENCVSTCLQELSATRRGRLLLLDDAGLILEEYLKQKPHGFPQGPGDAFLIWVNDNQANPMHVRNVRVTPLHGDPRAFDEFPDDLDLATFDRQDRKFVAVALASGGTPTILNATDTDWWIHRIALQRVGVHIKFLCPNLMA